MQHIFKNSRGNEKCLNNFKPSINKNNHFSAVKRIVNLLQDSVCNANVDDVMIKMYRLPVYCSYII